MTPQQKFEIIFTGPVFQHLATIERKYYSLIRSTIEEQLTYTVVSLTSWQELVYSLAGAWADDFPTLEEIRA